MRTTLSSKDLAELARINVEEIERYRSMGLLDPDGDGALDELDVLRLRILMHYRGLGYSDEDLAGAIRKRSRVILYADLLFEGADSVPLEEVAERTGLELADVRDLRRAVGLPGNVPAEDVKFYEAVKGMVDGGVPLEVIKEVARVYGDTLRRLADTEVRMIRAFVASQGPSSLLKERAESERLQTVQELVGPILEPLLLNVHRQHLLRSSVREAVADLEAAAKGEDRETIEAAIVFVDLASFTPLAQVHGDEVAAAVLDRFDNLVRTLLEERTGGTLVKQIGDAFMLTFDDPAEGVLFVVHLDEAGGDEPFFPALRAGIHSGPVLYKVGDYVGNTVNIASRIAALARANEILITEPVSKAAVDAGLGVLDVGAQDLPGLNEPLRLWKVVRPRLRRQPRDPVCGMTVGDDAAARLRYRDFEYSFCSPACLQRFMEDPMRYVGTDEGREDKPVL